MLIEFKHEDYPGLEVAIILHTRVMGLKMEVEINGKPVEPTNRFTKTCKTTVNGTEYKIQPILSAFSGQLKINGNKHRVVPRPSILEWIISFLPILLYAFGYLAGGLGIAAAHSNLNAVRFVEAPKKYYIILGNYAVALVLTLALILGVAYFSGELSGSSHRITF